MSTFLNCSSRFMMMVMVIVFWCFSALLMFMGIKMLMLIGSVDAAIENKYLTFPAIFLILLSLLCLIIGIIGCAGASFESRKTQGVYGAAVDDQMKGLLLPERQFSPPCKHQFFLLLLLILLLEVVGCFLCITYKEQLQGKLSGTITTSVMHNYTGGDDSISRSIDYIQETFECCGVKKSKDWLTSDWAKEHKKFVPGSCCSTDDCDNTKPVEYNLEGKKHYDKGCEAKLVGRIGGWLGWLIALAVIFVLFEVLAMFCTCIRFKHSKKIRYQTLSEEQAAHGYRA